MDLAMGTAAPSASFAPRTPKLSRFGELIFLDRYARKDHDYTHLQPDQTVVACLDTQKRQRELAVVVSVDLSKQSVTVRPFSDNTDHELPVSQVDLPVESLSEAHRRVAVAVAGAEGTKDLQRRWAEEFFKLLSNHELVPAGRVLAGAGVEERLTCFNCYVLPPPRDSRHGIIETLDRMSEIMSRGGGVGIPLMSLRPRYAHVRGVNGRSSGSIAWGELYSFSTGLIEQGGSRQGALMLVQYDWHPDIFEFVTAKKEGGKISKANLSVAVSDALMKAVEEDADWNLVFPDTTYPNYDSEWTGDLSEWKQKGYPVNTYRTIKARELWDAITQAAWESAEPGIIFIDRYNAEANSWYYPEGKIYCTNPCGEQGIPGWSVCNLGHLNLPRFLVGDGMHEAASVDWTKLGKAVRASVRFMDNVIDIAFAPFPQNDIQQKSERRVGLGTMGLGEMLLRLQVRYGANDACLKFLDRLYGFIAAEAYLASSELAQEKGAFPKFNAGKLLQSGFASRLPASVREAISSRGLRNVTLLTQAPTGTVGTMMGTSTGIEPYPWWEWERKGRLGSHFERALPYEEYLKIHEDAATGRESISASERHACSEYLPNWFVTAAEMQPEDHAKTQATIQRWVDASIAKTSNLPADYTMEQVADYYRLLYTLGCKGGTVYRDRSRSEQVLNAPAPQVEEAPELRPIPDGNYDIKARSLQSPVGKLSVKLGLHPDDSEPFECWLDVSKAGTVVAADREALARLISLVLRLDSPIPPRRRLRLVIDQLGGIGGGDSTGFGSSRTLSLPDAVSKALEGLLETVGSIQVVDASLQAQEAPSKPGNGHSAGNGNGHGQHKPALDICPSCHQATLVRTEGCQKCVAGACGFSRC